MDTVRRILGDEITVFIGEDFNDVRVVYAHLLCECTKTLIILRHLLVSAHGAVPFRFGGRFGHRQNGLHTYGCVRKSVFYDLYKRSVSFNEVIRGRPADLVDAYEDLIRTSPKAESFVDTPDGRGTVVEVDLLRQRVKVKMEEHPETITSYANGDIAVLRNGKAKKNDPPIPEDLAPISGSKKQERKEKEESGGRMFLDPIKFRYSTETIADATEEVPEVAEQPNEESRPNRSRRRNRKPGKSAEQKAPSQPKAEQPKKEAPKAEPKKEQSKKEQPQKEGEAPKPGNKPHRRHYHHRRPKSGGENKGV